MTDARPALGAAAGGRWKRAALTAAVTWATIVAVGSIVISSPVVRGTGIGAFVSPLLVFSGIPVMRWAGHRYDLRETGAWIRASALMIGIVGLGVGFVGCVYAMAVYG